MRRASAKSEWEIAAPLFREAELLKDLLHFQMAGNQENRTRLLILAAHLEIGSRESRNLRRTAG